MEKQAKIPESLWNKVKDALTDALDALNDANTVVDPGEEDEITAYEKEIYLLETTLDDINNCGL